MPTRYELSDAQWGRIKDMLPGRLEHVGRTAADNRLFVNGVLWVLRRQDAGALWQVPRFMRWAQTGVWDRIFAATGIFT